MRAIQSQAAFVFRYFLDRSFGQRQDGRYISAIIEATTSYDEGLDFVFAFQAAFPGRLQDQNHDRASQRLRRLLKRLYDDGWLDRKRVSNHGQYHPMDEPNWQYAYVLADWLLTDLKSGDLTPESAAEKWAVAT